MAAKSRPYEQFGPFILFKKLEADALGDLWRAARIDGHQLGPFLALLRLSGGDRNALMQSVTEARAIAPLLSGSTFVKGQIADVQDAVPFIAFEYAVGRSLRHIVDRARGGAGAQANPIPLDQAILIAQRIALSLGTIADMRYGGNRLLHGALIPQFVWITDDGEVRVAGQHLGKGIVASLKDAKVGSEIGRYFSPEYHGSAEPTKASEIYSVGAILYLLVTGHEPPDPLSVTAFTQTVRAAKTMTGQPIPLEIRTVLDKSLILDPLSRYPSMTEMKQALDGLTAKYSATTFNLAFYLSNLLKKELEAETAEREKESKLNLAPPPPAPIAAPTFDVFKPAPKRRVPLFAAIGVVVLAAAGGVALMYMRQSPARAQPATARPAAAQPRPVPVVPQPVAITVDSNAQKKAFEEAVNQKLQQEMLKLQTNFNKDLQQKKSKNAPVVTEAASSPVVVAQPRPTPVPVVEEHAPSAAALDERRLTSRPETTTQPPAVVAPAATQSQPAVAAPSPAPTIREGDVVDQADLDTPPRLLRPPVINYPPMAMRQRAEASIILTALVSENGDVVDVHVLRGDPRFGFNDAAIRALRSAKFSPAVKDGKRVKTWWPQTVNFKL